MQRTLAEADSSSSDDEGDQDDAHVLVSAIANLESLILKSGAGGRSTRNLNSEGIIATGGVEGDSMPNRALDAALIKAEEDSGLGNSNADTRQPLSKPMLSSPAPMSGTSLDYSPLISTPTIATLHNEGRNNDDTLLLEELHRIQGMLGTVMKQKKRKGGNPSAARKRAGHTSPERDTEVERLQEALVVSSMRKADSSFLQSQLNMKEG
jgi:hypothetical protein